MVTKYHHWTHVITHFILVHILTPCFFSIHFNNYTVMVLTFEVVYDKLKAVKICTSRNYEQNWITELQILGAEVYEGRSVS